MVFWSGSPLLLLLLVVSDTPESSNTTSSVFSTGGTSVTGLYVCVCVCVCGGGGGGGRRGGSNFTVQSTIVYIHCVHLALNFSTRKINFRLYVYCIWPCSHALPLTSFCVLTICITVSNQELDGGTILHYMCMYDCVLNAYQCAIYSQSIT